MNQPKYSVKFIGGPADGLIQNVYEEKPPTFCDDLTYAQCEYKVTDEIENGHYIAVYIES